MANLDRLLKRIEQNKDNAEKTTTHQLTIAGEEAMLFQTIDIGEENKAYNPEKDIEFFTAPWTNQVVLDGTNFALIFPNDLHAGSFTVDTPNTVKKFVFKLKID